MVTEVEINYEELNEAFFDAFRSYDDLERMLKFKLSIKLSQIAPDTKPLSQVIFDLLDYFDSRGKLSELIQKAHKYNPDNHKLKKIYKTYFPLELPKNSILDEEKVSKLIWILQDTDFNNINFLKNICSQTLQKFTDSIQEMAKCNELFSLLETLLKSYPKQKEDDIPAIFEFAQRLYDCEKQNIMDSSKYEVKKWLIEATAETKFSFPISYPKPVEISSISYLAIVVQEAGEPESLEISLFSFKDNNNNFKENEIRSYTCHENNLITKIVQIIDQAEIEIDCFNQKSVIEIFLSYKQIAQNQCIDIKEIKRQYNRKVTIGRQYCLAIRILERYEHNIWTRKYTNLENLRNRWQMLLNYIKKYNSATHILKQNSDFLDEINAKGISKQGKEFNWEESLLTWERKKILLLILNSNLISESESETLFEYILTSGIPIFIWNKKSYFCYNSQNFETEVKKIINHDSLLDISSLYQRIKYFRENSFVKDKPERCIGYHLGFLLDHPDRIPSSINNHILVPTGQ